MTDFLEELFNDVPADLASYFELVSSGSFTDHDELELNLLPADEAVNWSFDFRDFHPIVQQLGGVILDDPNTSNHHVYLSIAPCAGSVLFLDHDGDSRIVFPTLARFLEAASEAIKTETSLRTFHPDAGVLLSDQSGLSAFITGMIDGERDRKTTSVVMALIPSMDLSVLPLLHRLASDKDFYISEAVGNAIAHRPGRELAPLAKVCMQHAHPQAASAGARALAAIEQLQ